MPRRKIYEPHCPAYNCSGGYAHRLHKVSAEGVHMPADVLAAKPPLHEIYSCSYCQFVWFQSTASFPGFDPTPAGFYDNFLRPQEWISTPDYQIREENTPQYWRARAQKNAKRKRR